MRLRHRTPGRGLADLDHHDRLAQPRRVVGGEHERAAVLETLDVAGDHTHLGLVREVAGEVGELEIDLVARRRPVRKANPDFLALEHRPALVSRLGDERDRRALEVGAEILERVEVGVGPEQAHVAAAHQSLESPLTAFALGAGLREPGREDHRELGLAPQHLLERLLRPSGEDDREVDVARDVEHRLVAPVPEHRFSLRVHGIEGRPVLLGPLRELARHRGVGLRRLLGRADQGDRLAGAGTRRCRRRAGAARGPTRRRRSRRTAEERTASAWACDVLHGRSGERP